MRAPRPASRCINQERGTCPQCRAFALSLNLAIVHRDAEWTPGVLGRLNAAAKATTDRK